ncbi:MAG: archaellin/type IV pilin N-terminal domain-containing protein [Nanoarchaeota archaeon]
MHKKRGVSPLLATVIMVSLVILVVAIVTLWGKKFTEQAEEKEGTISRLELECTDVNIDVISTENGQVTVENKGETVDGVTVVVRGDGESGSMLYNQEIESGDTRSFPYEGIPGVGSVEEVVVIPALGKGIYRPCSGQRVELEL